MAEKSARIERERKTVILMIQMYCSRFHAAVLPPCPECDQLTRYAAQRIDRCVYRGQKPVCAKCDIHCYKPKMRESIRGVMRYSGPRMLLHHPVLGITHFFDRFRKPPPARNGSRA